MSEHARRKLSGFLALAVLACSVAMGCRSSSTTGWPAFPKTPPGRLQQMDRLDSAEMCLGPVPADARGRAVA
jgi:hypothetical protein